MQTWLCAAELGKTKDLQGRFVVRSIANLPFLLSPGLEVHFVPPQFDAPRRARVSSITKRPKGEHLVEFEGIKTRDVAQRLVGCFCLVDRGQVELGLDDKSMHSLLQYQVEDKTEGRIGTVEDLIENPAQSLLRIRAGEEELLVPLVDEIVTDIDHQEKKIYTELPKGLRELGSSTPINTSGNPKICS